MAGQEVRAGRAFVEFFGDDQRLKKATRSIEAHMRRFGNRLSAIGQTMVGLGAAAAVPFAATIKAAADAQESLNRFEQVFKDQADAARAFAETTAKEIGRSKFAIMDALATFQSFFVGLGAGGEEARALSQRMQSLALDFASFNNLSDDEALQRFISALSGSSEVLDKFGVNIRVAALEEEALKQGITESVTSMSEMEKALLRLSIIERVLGDQGAIGDAARTAGSFSNQMKALQAAIKDTSIEIGTALIPIATKLLAGISGLASIVKAWTGENKGAIVILAKVAAGMLALGAAALVAGKSIVILSGAVGGLGKAFLFLQAHPIAAALTLIGVAAVGIAAHFATATSAVEDFRDALLDLQARRVNLENAFDAERLLEDLREQRKKVKEEFLQPTRPLAFGGAVVVPPSINERERKALDKLDAEIAKVESRLVELRKKEDEAAKGMLHFGRAGEAGVNPIVQLMQDFGMSQFERLQEQVQKTFDGFREIRMTTFRFPGLARVERFLGTDDLTSGRGGLFSSLFGLAPGQQPRLITGALGALVDLIPDMQKLPSAGEAWAAAMVDVSNVQNRMGRRGQDVDPFAAFDPAQVRAVEQRIRAAGGAFGGSTGTFSPTVAANLLRTGGAQNIERDQLDRLDSMAGDLRHIRQHAGKLVFA